MTNKKEKQEQLQQLAWLLDEDGPKVSPDDSEYVPPYGDLTELNTCRVILDAVGRKTLKQIAEDSIDLLNTSVAVFEKNGDYAFGMFSSGWCRLMDSASWHVCSAANSVDALASGKFFCHDCCWNESAKLAIESGAPTDIQCAGGLNLYCEPIYANGEVIGAINIGYGNPPKDSHTLKDLAKRFLVDEHRLKAAADGYQYRPPFLIRASKKRLATAASIIGEIVQRVIAEQKIHQSETRYRTLIDNIHVAVAVHNADTSIAAVNPRSQALLGLTEEQLIGKTAVDPAWRILDEEGNTLPQEDYPVNRVLASQGQLRNMVAGIVHSHKKGPTWVLVNGDPVFNASGVIQQVIITFINITERKLTQDALKKELALKNALSMLYEPLVSSSSTMEEICTIVLQKSRDLTESNHGYVSEIDPESRNMHSFTLTDMIPGECGVIKNGKSITFPIGKDGQYSGMWGHTLNTQKPFFTNSPSSHPSTKRIPPGHIRLQRFLSVPVLIDNTLVGQIALANKKTDYTDDDLEMIQRIAEYYALAVERSRTHQAIEKSEARFRRLAENAQDVIYRMSLPSGIYEYMNPAATAVFGYTPEDFYNSPKLIQDIIHPEYRNYFNIEWEKLVSGHLEPEYRYKIVDKSGRDRWLHQRNVLVKNKKKHPVAIEGIVSDITEQMQNKAKIESALKEKETLLREIHHRVKNNLQVISSILEMSSQRTGNEELLDILKGAESKIQSMSLIHTQLYQKNHLDRIDMDEFIRELIDYLLNTYNARHTQIQCRIDISIEPLSLNIAIPCGLLINEVVTNAIKHAFEDIDQGRIDIVFSHSPDGTATLMIKDNGTGIPEGINITEPDLPGLELIYALTHQLNGTIEIRSEKGTEVLIQFKLERDGMGTLERRRMNS